MHGVESLTSLYVANEGILYCITEGAEENTLACVICNIYLALYKDYYYPFFKDVQ